MDKFFLNPRNVNAPLVGTVRKCSREGCSKEKKFEDGVTHVASLERDDEILFGFFWYCSLTCYTIAIEPGGTA